MDSESMRATIAYRVLLAVFYLSIPIGWDGASIAMLLKGYTPTVAFRLFDPENYAALAAYYDAYKAAFPLTHAITLASAGIWFVTFCSSMVVIYLRNTERRIAVPYRLDTISAVISFLLCLIPIFFSGWNGWPIGLL